MTIYIKDYEWGQQAETILFAYCDDRNAVKVIMTLLNMFKTTENSLVGKPCAQGQLSLMMDLTTNLPRNPFWQAHGTTIMADVSSRWRDWMRAVMVIKDADGDALSDADSFQSSALRSSFISLADYAILYETSDKPYLPRSANLHSELLRVLT